MKLVIYQTSDLHGYVNPSNYIEYKEQGILKIASYIKEDERNYDFSLKIDCGDLIQGSPLTHYLSKNQLSSNPIVSLMEKVGFDYYILGNHEFNYGRNYLNNAYKPIEAKILNSNIKGLDFSSKPYDTIEFDSYKISIIGATTQYIPNWEQASTIEGIDFLDPVETYGIYENDLKENSDLVILAYHGGFEKSLDGENIPTEKLTKENQASQMLETYDSIDIILSGHQHRSFIEDINGVICSQPLNNGQNFTKIVLDLESGEKSYELLNVSDLKIEINKEFALEFTDLNNKVENYLDTIIGTLSDDIPLDNLFKARFEGHPFINLLHQVQLEVSGADFSSICLFDSAIGFSKNVTVRDILVNYPYPNTLKVLKISGHKLKEAVEKSGTYFVLDENAQVKINEDFLIPKVQNYNYDLYYGFDYIIDLNLPEYSRVSICDYEGAILDLDREYTIVLNNYRATNTSVYPSYEGAEVVKEINVDVSELIIDYFAKHKNIKIEERKNFRVIN